MRILSLIAVVFMAAFIVGGPATAWEDVKGMNVQIDQTNFIVGRGCSGTLISTEYRLILTAHHCVSGDIKTVTRKEIGPDGKVEEVEYEKRNRVTISQKDYAKYETVGAISYQTEIIAYDKAHDLALLQLVGVNLRSSMSAPIRNAEVDIMRGERVFAVGNPLGFDATITSGVVSSTNRKFKVSWDQIDELALIQFDANVNGGNSGGALYDDTGRVIGVVVAGVRGSDLGFAIPIFELYPMLDELCMASIYDDKIDDVFCQTQKEAEAAKEVDDD